MGATANPGAARAGVRDRLLDSADELFYEGGVHVVGIDRVIEHAGVAKASLYKHFPSKDALVAAYLERRADRLLDSIEEAVGRRRDPMRRVLAVFDHQASRMAAPTYNGCAFSRAAAEAGADSVTYAAHAHYRSRLLDLLAGLASEAGARQPGALAEQLRLVYDGAADGGRYDPVAAARHARTAAVALLAAGTATH